MDGPNSENLYLQLPIYLLSTWPGRIFHDVDESTGKAGCYSRDLILGLDGQGTCLFLLYLDSALTR